jgi:hypothetical protein
MNWFVISAALVLAFITYIPSSDKLAEMFFRVKVYSMIVKRDLASSSPSYKTSYIKVNTVPSNASIDINNQHFGKSPATVALVTNERAAISVQFDGYQPYRTIFVPNGDLTLNIELKIQP